jgi:hypothetical protein
LIDERTSRAAAFYAPADWEQCLGADLSRQQDLKALKVFNAVSRSGQQRMK